MRQFGKSQPDFVRQFAKAPRFLVRVELVTLFRCHDARQEGDVSCREGKNPAVLIHRVVSASCPEVPVTPRGPYVRSLGECTVLPYLKSQTSPSFVSESFFPPPHACPVRPRDWRNCSYWCAAGCADRRSEDRSVHLS